MGRELTDDERSLCLDFWDCSGRSVLAGAHPVYFTDVCVYYVVCSLEDSLSVEKVPTLVHTIYQKALRPQIYIIATRGDKFSEDDCQTKLDLIKRSIDSADLVSTTNSKETSEYFRTRKTVFGVAHVSMILVGTVRHSKYRSCAFFARCIAN